MIAITPKSFWKGHSVSVPRGMLAGDIRIGLANRGYGPLVAGPEGAWVLFVFASGAWPAIKLGNNDGSTLGSDLLEAHFDKVQVAGS